MMARSHFYLKWEAGRDPDECLFESAEFNATPLGQRVVSSIFKPLGRFGFFRLHADAASLCQRVLRAPPQQRNFCVVILDRQPVRMFLDLDMKTTARIDSQLLDLMVADVLACVKEGFAAAYPAQASAGLGFERMWYFSATDPTKASIHVHADPDSPHPVWASVVELGAFIEKYVIAVLEKELKEGKPRALRLWIKSPKAGNPDAMEWFIDRTVYHRTQNLKLPLCSKPGKTTMRLHRAPDGVRDTNELKQLQVGMPQVWANPSAASQELQLLPQLQSSSSRAQPEARTGGAGARKAIAAPSTPESRQLRAQQAAIVTQILQPVNVGHAASWYSFEVDAAARTFKGTLAKLSARCPFQDKIHGSNQLKVDIRNGQLYVSCWAPVCKGRAIRAQVNTDLLSALFDDSRGSACAIDRGAISSDGSNGGPSPSQEEDGARIYIGDTEEHDLERDLAIEQEIEDEQERPIARELENEHKLDVQQEPELERHIDNQQELDIEQELEIELQMTREKRQELVNFGMPLRPHPGVHRIDRRYLLPNSLDEPGAEQKLKQLMLHPRLGIRSPMDTAKSSAFIMYIKWCLRQFPDLRILLVSSRVTLTGSLKQRLTDEGVPCKSYLDCDADELRQAQVVIVQLDSIFKLVGAKPYDIVLMDESESTLFHFHATTLKRRGDAWQTLCMSIRRATQLILLDASLGGRSQDMLQHVVPVGRSRPEFAQLFLDSQPTGEQADVRIWVNECRTDDKTYYVHRTAEDFHAQMHELLKQGKRIAIASNLCKKAKALHCEIVTAHPLLRVLLLTSESSQADKLADCNVKWLEYDVVIYSPTIGAGVDFNPPSGPHFDVVMAWGGTSSNPAREFVQMSGRVRKVRDGEMHLYIAGEKREECCTRESIIQEVWNGWGALSMDNRLDPALRQLGLHQDGQIRAKFHEPIYLELYIQNRLEQALSREGMFRYLVLAAIKDNLDATKGGSLTKFGATQLDKQTKKEVKKTMCEAVERQTQEECELIARDTFASAKEQTDSGQLMESQRGTQRDKRLAKRQHIIRTYQLQVPMIVERPADQQPGAPAGSSSEHKEGGEEEQWLDIQVDSGSQAAIMEDTQSDSLAIGSAASSAVSSSPGHAQFELSDAQVPIFAAFIRDHGDTTDQFKLFCKANGLILKLHQLWMHKFMSCPGELPMQLPEWHDYENSRLLKGLLRVAGFTAEPRRSSGHHARPAADPNRIWEDGGDLCFVDSVNSDIVEESAKEPDAREWLNMNVQSIQDRYGRKIQQNSLVIDVVRALRAALKKVGVELVTYDKKKQARGEDGLARTVTSWKLESPRRDSFLELAYAVSLRFRPAYELTEDARSTEWDVRATLDAHQPVFRWQLLTGVERPEHWSPIAPPAAIESSARKATRKRKKKNDAS